MSTLSRKRSNVYKSRTLINGYCRLCNYDVPSSLVLLIYEFYRKPKLKEVIEQELVIQFSRNIAQQFMSYIHIHSIDSKTIFQDLTNKRNTSTVMRIFDDSINKFDINDLLLTICTNSSPFAANSSKILFILQLFVVTECDKHLPSNGQSMIDFSIKTAINRMISDDEIVLTLKHIYLFGFDYMYSTKKKSKFDICFNNKIQCMMKNIKQMNIPIKICQDLIGKEKGVDKSAYFVRNIYNQYLMHTFVPFCAYKE